MRIFCSLILLLFLTTSLVAQEKGKAKEIDPYATDLWSPVPKKISPGLSFGDPPSDAVILFDGKDMSKWSSVNGGPAKWEVKDGVVTIAPGTGSIKTNQTFNDIQLHLEWRVPASVKGEGQDRGNSGIFFQERYELQVLDSYENPTYVNGQAGSIYKQHIPLVNPTRKAGEWQTYDVVYNAPRFSESGSLISPGHITVFLNGVLVQNNSSIWGKTENQGSPMYTSHGKGSIIIQDHDHQDSFRNIWLREL